MSKKHPEMMKFMDQVRIDGWVWTVKYTILNWWFETVFVPWYKFRELVRLPVVDRWVNGKCVEHFSDHGPISCKREKSEREALGYQVPSPPFLRMRGMPPDE